jgi:hypothetical protein
VVLAADEELVGAFGADGTYEPLGVAVRSWGARRRFDNCDVFAAKYVVERSGEFGVPVADEETERGDPVRQFHGQDAGGLGDPWSGRVRGDPENVNLRVWISIMNST